MNPVIGSIVVYTFPDVDLDRRLTSPDAGLAPAPAVVLLVEAGGRVRLRLFSEHTTEIKYRVPYDPTGSTCTWRWPDSTAG